MRIHVPTFPAAAAIVRPDGSAELTVNGISRPIPAAGVDDARRQITAAVVALAAKMQRPIRLATRDGANSYQLAVHPNGHVTALDSNGYTDVTAEPTPETSQPTAPPTEASPTEVVAPHLVVALPRTAAPAPALPEPDERTMLDAPASAAPVLELSTGELISVAGNGIIGRRPSAGHGELVTHLVRVDDTRGTLSRSHLAFGLTPEGAVWVADRDSANGTWLHDEDGRETKLPTGAQHVLTPGTRIKFGEHWLALQAGGES